TAIGVIKFQGKITVYVNTDFVGCLHLVCCVIGGRGIDQISIDVDIQVYRRSKGLHIGELEGSDTARKRAGSEFGIGGFPFGKHQRLAINFGVASSLDIIPGRSVLSFERTVIVTTAGFSEVFKSLMSLREPYGTQEDSKDKNGKFPHNSEFKIKINPKLRNLN